LVYKIKYVSSHSVIDHRLMVMGILDLQQY
jgi:Fe2+ transport system protein FeoA